MTEVAGTYQNGVLKLDREYISKDPVKVIVTFLEEPAEDELAEKRLSLADFSLLKGREILKNYSGSISDAVIEERRSSL